MKELPQPSLPPESFPKKAARFVLKKAIHTLPASVLIFAACSGGGAAEKNNNQELKDKESSGYALPFPEGETWFLTTGPHGDGYSKGIKYAIDIAPPELGRLNGNCPIDDSNVLINNRVVTASASGEVVIKGDDRNRNNLDHSVIHIKNKNGLTQVYMHLDETKVKLGDRVKQGDPLGNPSCEYPPGGANTGPHVHIGLMKDGQPISIDGVKIGGWTIHEGVNGQDGTMTKPGEQTRTADIGRFTEIHNYRGIRNDLPNNPNRAVVASPKSPILPISGSVKEKSISATPIPTAIPTPKPTETPKPAVEKKVSLSKKPEELFKALLTNPISSNILPQGMSSRGISAGEIDATGKALKEIGAVNISITDSVSIAYGGVYYGIFPDSSTAKSASEIIGTNLQNGRDLKDFPYPAKVYTSSIFGSTIKTIVMSVENVTVAVSFTGTDPGLLESRAISLGHAAIEHLKKTGR